MFPGQPLWSYQTGIEYSKPLIAGCVKNEGQLFIYSAFSSMSYDLLMALLHIILKTDENVNKVLKQYPLPTNTSDYRNYASNVATDGLFHCPNRNLTDIMSQRYKNDSNYNENIYLYHFNHLPTFSNTLWDDMGAYECLDHVCHGDDLPFVFRPNAGGANTTITPSEINLAKSMQFYWSQFSKTNIPGDGNSLIYNNGTKIEWKKFNSFNQSTMVFQTNNIQLISNYDKQKCIIWDQISYPWLPHP